MPVDIRATVTCSLGTLITGSISDDYLQGNGLVKTRGTVEIAGTITPAIGTAVTISYTKGGVTRTIPRKLRVLSSFANPYTRTTSVELGCKLTYLSDLRESIDWSVFDDSANSSYNAADARTVPLPIRASSVMDKCLTELGITASSNPLTNVFSVGEFDFSAGYVQVLSDLLLSESYFGYLNSSEVLQVVNLAQDKGTGTVYTASEIIDFNAINSGQLPGESVTVSYSTLRLKPPDPEQDVDELNWETNTVVAGPNLYYIGNRVYTGNEVTTTTIQYRNIDGKDVPIFRKTIEEGSTAKVAGSIGTSYVNNDIEFGATRAVLREELEVTEYDKKGNRTRTEVSIYEAAVGLFGSISMDYAFGQTDYVTFSTKLFPRERIVSRYTRVGDVEQEVTTTYVTWILTPAGQQAIAEYRGRLGTASAVAQFASNALSAGLVHLRTVTSINSASITRSRPSSVLTAGQAKGNVAYSTSNGTGDAEGNPDRSWRTESTSELELALGSATAQRRVQFSMPYASDDYFSGPSGGPFTVVRSDAAAKASRYGRVQNRLFLGNRNGANIQLAPERLPTAPFAPMYVQANGLTAEYRANGNQWAFTSDGIACSTDALFWSAVGGTGTFWFPVAPGVTTLPTTPPVVNGEITPTASVPPYNETVSAIAVVRTGLTLTTLPYALTLLTVLPALRVRPRVSIMRVTVADGGSFTLTGNTAELITDRVLRAAAGSFALTGKGAALYPPVLFAEPGGFALTGKAAALVIPVTIRTGTEAPLLGSGAATDYTGWTRVRNADTDDGFDEISSWPFTLQIDSTNFTGAFVGANAYITFGTGSTTYSSLSASNPDKCKIHFGAGDGSMQRVYYIMETAPDGSDVVRLRYEGTSSRPGTPGNPSIVAEFAFYAPRSNGEQWIELRVGLHNRTTGPFMIANTSTAYATGTIAANSSWVFVGNSTGTSWTLTSNRYIGAAS